MCVYWRTFGEVYPSQWMCVNKYNAFCKRLKSALLRFSQTYCMLCTQKAYQHNLQSSGIHLITVVTIIYHMTVHMMHMHGDKIYRINYSGTSLRRTLLGQSHVSIIWRVSFIQRFLGLSHVYNYLLLIVYYPKTLSKP